MANAPKLSHAATKHKNSHTPSAHRARRSALALSRSDASLLLFCLPSPLGVLWQSFIVDLIRIALNTIKCTFVNNQGMKLRLATKAHPVDLDPVMVVLVEIGRA